MKNKVKYVGGNTYQQVLSNIFLNDKAKSFPILSNLQTSYLK